MKNATCASLLVLLIWLLPTIGWGQGQYGVSQVYMQASLDVARQILTGPSYEDYKSNYNTFGFNVGLYYNPFRAKEELQEDYHLPTNSLRYSPLNPASLLASIDRRPGPTAPDPKAGSEFLRHLSPLVGVQLIGKGGKYSDRFGTSTTHMTYLEIPAYVIYTHNLPEGKGQLFGGLGFYLAYGLWGTLKFDDPGGKSSFSAFDKANGYKRFDAGLNFMAGYQLPEGLRLSLVHELGLISIDPVAGSDKTKNRVWSLNVGYPLKKLTTLIKKK